MRKERDRKTDTQRPTAGRPTHRAFAGLRTTPLREAVSGSPRQVAGRAQVPQPPTAKPAPQESRGAAGRAPPPNSPAAAASLVGLALGLAWERSGGRRCWASRAADRGVTQSPPTSAIEGRGLRPPSVRGRSPADKTPQRLTSSRREDGRVAAWQQSMLGRLSRHQSALEARTSDLGESRRHRRDLFGRRVRRRSRRGGKLLPHTGGAERRPTPSLASEQQDEVPRGPQTSGRS